MMTGVGVLLGTAAYMSPEQAKGRPADKRSDIWAFGCVLYEMLTGRRAFDGDDVADTLAEVLKGTPDWTALPATTPQGIRRLLRRCLEKDRKERLADLGTARLDIKDALGGPADEPLQREPPRSWQRRLLPIGLAMLVTALLAGYGMWTVARSAPRPASPVTRSLLGVHPFGQATPGAAAGSFEEQHPTESKGHRVVARWTHSGIPGRQWERCAAVPAAARRAASHSHSRHTGRGHAILLIGRRVDWLSGGRRVTKSAGLWWAAKPICAVPAATMRRRESSARAGEMATLSCSRPIGCLARACRWRAAGGRDDPAADEYAHRLPHVLPGGDLVLFTVAREVLRWDDAQIAIRSITTGEQKVLLEDAADARYVPGYLVFVRRGALMAAPFDVGRREVGGPVTLVEDVMQAANMNRPSADSGAGQFAVAGGALVYASGGVTPQLRANWSGSIAWETWNRWGFRRATTSSRDCHPMATA